MTNKTGLNFIRNVKNIINTYQLMSIVRHPECMTIQDKEIRVMVAFAIKYFCQWDFEKLTQENILYLERLAKTCRGDHKKLEHLTVLYRDYDQNLKNFELIKPKLQAMDINITEYDFPTYPKPSHLKHFHDAIAREINRYQDLIDEEKLKEINSEISNFTKTKEYTKFLKVKDDRKYTIVPVESGDCLTREGAYLHHCVGTYKERMARKESYIYFLRRSSKKDTPYFTLEVKLVEGRYILNQCYTFYDKTEKDESCRQFIKEWAKEHNIKIECTV